MGSYKHSPRIRNRPKLTLEDVRKSHITREALIALHETPGVGDLAICAVVQYGMSHPQRLLQDAVSLKAGDWREMGLSDRQCESIVDSFSPEARQRRARRCREGGIGIMTFLDERYSPLLREIADPPWVLYYRGNWELAHRPAVAIVGTRQATAYGRKVAEELAAGCSRRMTVVSGLARGIDTAAHQGAVRGAYGTIGVLATPVDQCYPPENRRIYEDIAANGLLLSETMPDASFHPGLFPMRNRVIAGLSMGVVVVEAAGKSGALITADLAIDYDRDVFIVPGPISSPRSKGALEYFRKGAIPVLDESDIFGMYEHRLPRDNRILNASKSAPANANASPELSQEEQILYELLLDHPCSVDELAEKSGMTFGLLQSVLLSLLIKRRVHQQPGSVYKVL
ncbi:DNA-processing protein DprA [Cohnella yongneupensis]|uniref:DNA-processing protein DprA n=1 Tax=Cohnella yongneupensis TaxID=425006 RepID=A0ABW0R9C4_9BACL